MIFVYPGIDAEINTDTPSVNCIVVENKRMFSEILEDISGQIEGSKGAAVISDGLGKRFDFSKKCELLTSFFPFELNAKSLVSKISSALERKALSPEYYGETNKLLAEVERYLLELSADFPCDLVFAKLGTSSLIKAAGAEAADDSASLSEKLLNYMELICEFDTARLFVTVNLRSFIEDGEAERFLESVRMHHFDLIMLENCEHTKLVNERRIIIDKDLCCIF